MAIDEVTTLILIFQNLLGIWCDNALILSQLIKQMILKVLRLAYSFTLHV
jgi:hypothetical protein